MPCPHLGAHRFHDGTGREEDLADLRQRDGAETAERRIGPLQIRHLGLLDDGQPRQIRLAPEVPRREPRALEPAADTRRALPGMRDQAGQPPALIAPPRGGRERLLGAVPVPATAVGRRNRLGSHYPNHFTARLAGGTASARTTGPRCPASWAPGPRERGLRPGRHVVLV